jgi:hypothetical protein
VKFILISNQNTLVCDLLLFTMSNFSSNLNLPRVYCKYGNSCYRKNPEHVRTCHPEKLVATTIQVSTNQVCAYGNSCYRTNPEHVRTCHPEKLVATTIQVSANQVCVYGTSCYRTNADHIKQFHNGLQFCTRCKKHTKHIQHANSGNESLFWRCMGDCS